jgi:hypothetical protein
MRLGILFPITFSDQSNIEECKPVGPMAEADGARALLEPR